MKDAVLLVFANKSDMENCMDIYEVTEQLELNDMQDRTWHVERTCALTGKSLEKNCF
jgi:hypothetical protein